MGSYHSGEERKQQAGLRLSQTTCTPDVSLPRAVSSFLLTDLHQLLTVAPMPGSVLSSFSSPPDHYIPLNPSEFCPNSPWCVSALLKPSYFIFPLNQLLQLSPV